MTESPIEGYINPLDDRFGYANLLGRLCIKSTTSMRRRGMRPFGDFTPMRVYYKVDIDLARSDGIAD
jgi:hypothetical protein